MSSKVYASVTLIRDLEGRLWGLVAEQACTGELLTLHVYDFSEYSTGITDFHGKVLVEGGREAIREFIGDVLGIDHVFIVGILNAIGLAAEPEMLNWIRKA